MLDIQNTPDTREVPLQKVGVKNVRYPVSVLDKNKKTQKTTASVNLFVNLPHDFKGTHMSRFIEVFHKYHEDISMRNFLTMLEEIRRKLEAERSFGKITFPYFIEKQAPVSKTSGFMEYTCTYEGESLLLKQKEGEVSPSLQTQASCAAPSAHSNAVRNAGLKNGERANLVQKFYISVKVPVATVCPCSKAISEYGAHNQRGFVKVKVLYTDFFWIEDIIQMVEKCASTPLYSILKRQDEKFVTENAYDNPRFVEDVVREVFLGLKRMNFKWFSVEAETEESIHLHNAYAYAECGAQN